MMEHSKCNVVDIDSSDESGDSEDEDENEEGEDVVRPLSAVKSEEYLKQLLERLDDDTAGDSTFVTAGPDPRDEAAELERKNRLSKKFLAKHSLDPKHKTFLIQVLEDTIAERERRLRELAKFEDFKLAVRAVRHT